MDFLTRFQGRTNLVPKKGIDHLMTEPSTPIEKLIVESVDANPQVFVKPRQMGGIKSHRSVSNPKGPQSTQIPRESIQQFSRTVAVSHPNQIGQQNHQLRIQTDPMFHAHESQMSMTPHGSYKNVSNLLQRTGNMSPKKQKMMTSHSTYMTPKEVQSATVTPAYSLNSTKTNSMLLKTNIVVPNQSYLKVDETPSSRFKLNNSMMTNRTIDPHVHKHSLNEAFKYSEAQNSKTQENRISLMNTFERQEKVLNKYRQGLFSEGAMSSQPRMSQSKGYLPLALSPKHEFLHMQQHYPPY